ncbi:uncharacterized protein PV06_08076 [Exophiala oligosperma]|uniref:Thioester reductase (TE) domain-containing protein n=1 Tax=Exophiala oligosperma TaxID=215243 RepID=A0A0D2DAM7_9EURO|nr:uncharacterized protein PV06_08076 [Exophiala oligosperma]KIW39465.1 hypothetical protein PV06_08076 [Exophiala oligosperma]
MRQKSIETTTDLSPERVSFFKADLSRPDLGLDKYEYHYLQVYATTTEIIHCAWPVDFNKSIHSFRPSLDGVLNLSAPSVATKELAHRRPLLLSLRPGIVSWIPVDRLPAVIVEVARGLMTTRDHSAAAAAPAGTKHKDSQAQVCHAVDPATVRWSDLVGMVQQALQQKTRSRSDGSLSGDYDVKIVSFEEWLGRLRYSSSGSGNHKGGFDETDADAVATQKNPGLNYSNSTSLHYCRIRNLLLPLLPLTPAGGGQQQRRQQGLLARLDLTKTIEKPSSLNGSLGGSTSGSTPPPPPTIVREFSKH